MKGDDSNVRSISNSFFLWEIYYVHTNDIILQSWEMVVKLQSLSRVSIVQVSYAQGQLHSARVTTESA